MDGLFDDSSKVEILVVGFWVGELLVNFDVGPHLWVEECQCVEFKVDLDYDLWESLGSEMGLKTKRLLHLLNDTSLIFRSNELV